MSSSAYPVIWAMKHAPVRDIYERTILFALADYGDHDGCFCYPSIPTMAEVAMCDTETVKTKLKALRKRGVIRFHQGPTPPLWQKLRKDRRPTIYELMIPCSWFSPQQREELDKLRAQRTMWGDEVNSQPLSSELRPDLSPVSARGRKTRSDKGAPNPKRSPKRRNTPPQNMPRSSDEQEKHAEYGHGGYETPPRSETGKSEHGGYKKAETGAIRKPNGGGSYSPNPPKGPSGNDSSLPEREGAASHSDKAGREDETASDGETAAPATDNLSRTESLVDDAVRRWGSGHRAPGGRDRHRLAERVAAELEAGGDEAVILDELTRDLGDARSAVSVVLGARTSTPGWGRSADPRPDATRYEVTGPRPVWCGVCDERTRLVAALAPDGSERMRRCQCHPEAATPVADGTDTGDHDDVDDATLARMRASLNSSGDDTGGLTPAARAAAAHVRDLLATHQQ